MPINPEIALQAKPPQPFDIAGAYKNALEIRQAQNQTTIQKMSIDKMRQEIQDELTARKILRDAYGEESVEDLEPTKPAAVIKPANRTGIHETRHLPIESPTAEVPVATGAITPKAESIQRYTTPTSLLKPAAKGGKKIVDNDKLMKNLVGALGERAFPIIEKIMNTDAAISKMSESELDLAIKRMGVLSNAIYSIKNVPVEQRPTAYKKVINSLIQSGIIKPEQVGKTIPAEYPGDDVIDMVARLNVSVKDQMTQETSRIRAESYSNRMEALNKGLEQKGEIDIQKLRLQADDLQRKLDRDSMLDERERTKIQNQLNIALRNIQQRESEEGGRNKRFAEGEKGRTERIKIVQDRIDERQKVAIEKGFSPTQISMAVHGAIRDMGYNDIEDVSEDDVEEFNQLVESYLGRAVPKFGTKAGGILGMGTETTVKKGTEVNPRNKTTITNPKTTAPSTAQPNQLPQEKPTSLQVPKATADQMQPGRIYKSKGSKGTVLYIRKRNDGTIVETTEAEYNKQPKQ